MTFVQKYYNEYTKIEKHVVVTTSYEGLDKEEELEMVPTDNNVNVVSSSKSNSSKEDFKNSKFFDEDINDQVIATPQTTINKKVVQAVKKLQASYYDNATKSSSKQCKKKVPPKI